MIQGVRRTLKHKTRDESVRIEKGESNYRWPSPAKPFPFEGCLTVGSPEHLFSLSFVPY